MWMSLIVLKNDESQNEAFLHNTEEKARLYIIEEAIASLIEDERWNDVEKIRLMVSNGDILSAYDETFEVFQWDDLDRYVAEVAVKN